MSTVYARYYFLIKVKHSALPSSAVDTVIPFAMHFVDLLNRQGALHTTAVSTEKSGFENSAAASVLIFLSPSDCSNVVQHVPWDTAISFAQQQ